MTMGLNRVSPVVGTKSLVSRLTLKARGSECLTFGLVQWGRQTVILTDLEVDLLSHARGDGIRWNEQTDASVVADQRAALTAKDTLGEGNDHCLVGVSTLITATTTTIVTTTSNSV